MIIDWNNNKNQQNLEKHGLSFDDAEIVFSGETVTFYDDRFDYGEERYITVKNVILLWVRY